MVYGAPMLLLLTTLSACGPDPSRSDDEPATAARPDAASSPDDSDASLDSGPTGPTGTTGTTGPTSDSSPWTGEPTASPYVFRSGPPPRNVLLITIDTTRADRLNSNGYTGATTSPTIDALLAEGLALRDHHSCSSWTMASFLCFLTGQDQVTLGYWPDNNNRGAGVDPFPGDLPSLAVRLKAEGFATGLVYANSFLSSTYHMGQGHDTEARGAFADNITDKAIDQLDTLAVEDRWLLHVHFNDPHNPYSPPEAYREPGTSCPIGDVESREGLAAFIQVYEDHPAADQQACLAHLDMLYDALIRQTDDAIGQILAHLDSLGERDETLIVFGTDHGEEFYEHGEWEHGHGLYQALNRATAGFVYPSRIPPAEHQGLTTHEDMLPTLLTILDLALSGEETGVPVGSEPVEAIHGLVYRNDLTVQSVTTETSVLIHHWEGHTHYYDRVDDPEQNDDLYDPADPEVQALWEALRPRIDDLAAKVTDGSQPLGLP